MKKILLASCVAAISAGVSAELTPLSEYELHSVTGQAGVDIELDVGISIGEIRYTDTETFDGNGVSDGDGGSLVVKDLTIGGGPGRTLFGFSSPGNTANLDNLRFKIDIDSDGDLAILGEPTSGGVGVVDILLTTGEISLQGAPGSGAPEHVLIDSMSLYGGALALELRVDGQTNDVEFYTAIGVEDLDIDMSSSFSLVIEDAVIAGSNYLEKIRDNRSPDASDRVAKIYVNMDADSPNGGVNFDFASNFEDENNIDVVLPSVALGGDQLGSFEIDDFQFRGVSILVSGH
jgi:hypothetical protein